MKRVTDFYNAMQASVPLRRDLVNYALMDVNKPTRVAALRRILQTIKESGRDEEGRITVEDEKGRPITLKPDYEVSELEKDIAYFEEGEHWFYDSLAARGLGEELKELVDVLSADRFDTFVTDRDGTVNNYCGRYRSSVQSAYNGVFLSRFASRLPRQPIILTSAPLMDTGIVDLSVLPENLYLLAGSKGREYRDSRGSRQRMQLTPGEEQRQAELNSRIDALLEKPENGIFAQIGSSFQRKVGETTVARQDVYGSVPQAESERFRGEVDTLLKEIDPDGSFFYLEDTGKDLEIIAKSGASGRHFTKGDGIAFLLKEVNQEARGARLLVCGDTSSDLPMVEKAVELGAEVTSVFVTGDPQLRKAVGGTGARAVFVSEPDTLVGALNLLGQRGMG
ncbi:MAG: trehalose 6-phosphate synthase [Alkalispirochaetaceae bacterium]